MTYSSSTQYSSSASTTSSLSYSNNSSKMSIAEDTERPTTSTTIIDNLSKWIKDFLKTQDLITLWESPGGWEGWLQVEVYKWAKNNNYAVLREERNVYPSKKKKKKQTREAADFAIAFYSDPNNKCERCNSNMDDNRAREADNYLIIEIKAQSWGQSYKKSQDAQNSFIKAVNEDSKKLKDKAAQPTKNNKEQKKKDIATHHAIAVQIVIFREQGGDQLNKWTNSSNNNDCSWGVLGLLGFKYIIFSWQIK